MTPIPSDFVMKCLSSMKRAALEECEAHLNAGRNVHGRSRSGNKIILVREKLYK